MPSAVTSHENGYGLLARAPQHTPEKVCVRTGVMLVTVMGAAGLVLTPPTAAAIGRRHHRRHRHGSSLAMEAVPVGVVPVAAVYAARCMIAVDQWPALSQAAI
jgi:hypothetical protein